MNGNISRAVLLSSALSRWIFEGINRLASLNFENTLNIGKHINDSIDIDSH